MSHAITRYLHKIFSRFTLSCCLTIALVISSIAPAVLSVTPAHAATPTQVNLGYNASTHSFDLTVSPTTGNVTYSLI